MAEVVEPVAPDHQKAWNAISSGTMKDARNHSSAMLTKLQQYEAAEAAQKAATQESAAAEKEAIQKAAKKRIKCHEAVVEVSTKSIQNIEEAMQVMEGVAGRLKQERYLRFADKQVNDRRSELRDKRPVTETFKDRLQIDLAVERNALETSRKEIQEREKDVKTFHEELATLRAQISNDTGIRRLKVEHESVALRPSLAASGPDRTKKKDDNALPPIAGAEQPDSPKNEADNDLHTTQKKEKEPKIDVSHIDLPLSGPEARQHNDKCAVLMEKVDSFVEKSDAAISKSRREAKVATTAVTKSMTKRTIDLAGLEKTLKQHIADVQYAMIQAERSLDKQKKRLDGKDEMKKQKYDETVALHEKLTKTKNTLVQDLRAKIEALNIDNSCRRITPQVASVPSDQGRPSSGNKTKGGKKLNNSASAPSITINPNDNVAEPASPTPASSKTLKAAGASVAAG